VSEQALRQVVDYLWDDEEEHYQDSGSPDGHIFGALRELRAALDRLRAALNGQPPPQLPEYECPHCGSDGVQYYEEREHRYVWGVVGRLPPGPDDDSPIPVLEDTGTCEDIKDLDDWFYCSSCGERWGEDYIHLKDVPQEQQQG
jgi:hypothetical protein